MSLEIGDRVYGRYLSHSILGIISQIEEIEETLDPSTEAFQITVVLEDPITIFGYDRHEVVLITRADGSPSRYTTFPDRLALAHC